MAAFALALLLTLPVCAQSETDTTTSTTESSDELSSFSVSGGTPGSWIQAALARHAKFIVARMNAVRIGETPGVRWSSSTTSETTSADTTGTSSDDASTDLSTLLSEYSGSLDSPSDLLGLLTGSSASGTTDASTSKSSGTQKSVTSLDTSATSDETTTSDEGTSSSAGFGGAIARLPTASDLYPTTSSSTGDERKFAVRLTDSLTETFLSALALESESTDFIELLKTAFDPLILSSAHGKHGQTDTTDDITESADGS